MKTACPLLATISLALIANLFPVNPLRAAEEIGFIERFALAPDRAATLDELIPGTEDFYYFQALHHQNEGRFGEVEQVLEPWVKRHGETPRVWEIRHRQALLLYPSQPEKSLAYLREHLNLRFDHQRETLGAKPDFPTQLDPALITWEAFLQRAFAESSTLDRVNDSGLDRILRSDTELDPTRRRALLTRLKYPDYPNLVGLIAAELRTKESKGFGEFTIHRALLPEQLYELLGLRPELADNQNFVLARLAKLAPSADIDWRQDAAEREAYLAWMWAYVKPLASSFNSLKAHVLHQLLDHHRRQGEYPRQLFLDYVKLPRPVPYAEPGWLQRNENRGSAQIDLNSDFRAITQMPPIGPRDEALVRDYLMQFFIEDDSWEGFSPYLRDTWLKPIFAEAKIVNGVDDAEKWSSLLSPTAFKALRDRVDVTFAIDNAAEFSADDAVKLDLHVKNVGSLMVKVYQINALSYYLEEKKEINTDLNLDGLIANSEQSQAYDEAPLRRVRRSFAFPELAGQRGTWVIEFIGNGISSRALVRKGRLQYLAHPSAAGTVLTVIDAQNQLAKKPAAWFGGRRYTPDEKGRILVPFSSEAGEQPLVLTDNDDSVATLEFLAQATENYQLEAGFHVERETLLPGRRATVAVRPRFTLNGTAVPTSLLKNVRLTVAFQDADGIASVNPVEDFPLHDDRESEYIFRVPERVRTIAFGLEATVEKLSAGGEEITLEAGGEDSSVFHVNQIDDALAIGDLHLTKIDGNYLLEVLGKTGEPLADRAVVIELHHRDFQSTFKKSLKSDPNGRIHLGSFDNIESFGAAGVDNRILSHNWYIQEDQHSYPNSLHTSADGAIEIPLMENRDKLTGADIALFEMRGGAFVGNHIDKLELANGLVKIAGLAPGDYQIVLRSPLAAADYIKRTIKLKVTSGTSSRGYVLGKHRHLQIKNTDPLQIASISNSDDGTLKIQLKNADRFTRVHIAATHFIPEYPLFPQLGEPLWREPVEVHRGDANSRYVSGRDIGEEYRYILERRDAEKFPGTMLARPGLILNPWELAKTDTSTDEAAVGDDYEKSEAMTRSSRGTAVKGPVVVAPPSYSLGVEGTKPSLDFLHNQAPVSYNLAPDENGVITLKRADLGDRQHLHVLAVNTDNAAYRQLSLPEPKGGTVISDLRLLTGLNPDGHFSQRRKVTVLGKGDVLRIADRRASEMQVYDTLAGVYATLAGISSDSTFAEFSFVLSWPKLDEKEKRRLYSEYACHELNFFLSRRDADFFQTVVQPYLVNKKDKTFFDHYLLEENLDRYLEAWRYGRLNTAERVLLARRIGGDELINTNRHVREGWEMLPVDPGQQQHWFFQALRGRSGGADYGAVAMEAADGSGIETDAFAFSAPAAGAVDETSLLALGNPAEREARAETMLKQQDQDIAMATRMLAEQEAKKSQSNRAELAAVMDMGKDVAEVEMLADGLEAGKELQLLRKQVRTHFRKLGQTREWAENNYYHLPIEQQTADLIAVSAFWRDYAAWDGKENGGFSSREFPAAANSFAEMMLALTLLDLPFEADEHKIDIDDQSLTLTAASTAVVFHEEIESVPVADNPPPILVSQNFFREGDRVRYEGNEQVDKFVTDEFLTGVLYGGQVVITNPTSSNQRLEVLLQIPVGALPANGSEYTRSTPVQLGAFSTERVEYFFYFPAPSGEQNFAHYPVHVARDEQAIAWAEPIRFRVVEELSAVDTSSWDYLSQHGSQQEVIKFLEQNNVQRLDLARIAWRVREDDNFLRTVVQLLDVRHAYDATLWSYGIHHNHVPTIRQFLLHQENFLAQSGLWLNSELVNIEPVERHWYQQLDYSPLVNARQHQLGRDRKILNERFRSQYQELMQVLSYQTEFAATDDLAVAAYLLLQDRVGEGLARLEKVDRNQVTTKLQLDLIDAHAALYRGDATTAGQIAARHAEHPVDRWRDLFAAVAEQVSEIQGARKPVADADAAAGVAEPDRDRQQETLAGSEPSFDFSIEGKRVQLTHRNLDEVRINYYEMDLEFLFSSNPFVARDSSRFRYIRPNFSETKMLKTSDDKQQPIDIPERFLGKNVLIEVVGAGIRKAEAWYANDLAVQVVENYGHLQVRTGDKAGYPLPKTYVKVYARQHDGSVKFFKDGYTDLRGKFDYISLNTDELDQVERFALLIISEDHGALVREANPPQQ